MAVESIVNSLLFRPPPVRSYDFPSKLIHLQTKHKEQITATMIRRHNNTNITILYSHGNAEDLNSSYHWMRKLSKDLNVNVIGYDYTGYALSTGTPSEHNCYADIEAVYDYLTTERGIAPHQIVLYGRSLGSGPSCWLAAKTARDGHSVGGVMLHSPFTSVYRVVLNLGFTMVGDKFPNVDHIKRATCPVTICHGRDDEVVPFRHGVNLHNAIPAAYQAKPYWMENVGHNDHGAAVESDLMRHFNKYLDYHILARRLYLKTKPGRNSRLGSPVRIKQIVVPRREV
mmetsp:Transcript_11015/g.18265  ORF Transcript_11015/g.18265 Transcript_11015/m.18265 type:complete len:285 (-) Transcript_11015:198-1052(-)|eukprot:CAMPEP_0119028816 /NCGR_PEP_ID=MMETSP1176-20130426/39580_1 /TAXON_ID=265551 /ORGANISM="Synedropsis recta cf, Strain CCMP1620" /LENGTH=284 /DNA_ID=CAMNT_0006985041 /DNA_START=27 /DNA_END=881 /DNA_ORIENTATION=+